MARDSARMTTDGGVVRMYVGGLAPDVTAVELRERFGRVAAAAKCALGAIELPPDRLTAGRARGFAYLTITGANAAQVLADIAKAYHRTKWRGCVLKVEAAKPDYRARLEGEWAAAAAVQRARKEAAEAERQRLLPLSRRGTGEEGTEGGGDQVIVNAGVAFEGKRVTSFPDWEQDSDEEMMTADDDDVVVEEEGTDAESTSSDDDDANMEEDSGVEEELEQDDGDSEEDGEQEDEGEEESSTSSSSEDDDDEEEAEEEEEVSEATNAVRSSVSPPKAPAVALDSNTRRLAALEEKLQKRQEKQRATITEGFVGKIDAVATTAKKITFDDDGEVAEVENGHEPTDDDDDASPTKSAVTVSNWLDSDDEEMEEAAARGDYGELNDEDVLTNGRRRSTKTLEFDDGLEDQEEAAEDAERFALRPEFLGERGKKLFELQKRFGGDQRFRMDARFIDDEENEYGGNQGLDELVDDDEAEGEEGSSEGRPRGVQLFCAEDDPRQLAENAEEMLREQDQALDLIAELFPDVNVNKIRDRRSAQLKKADPVREASWMGEMMRYDPRLPSSAQYERPMENSATSRATAATASEVAKEEKRAREEKEVLIGGDRFYETSSSLGSLFSRVRKNSEDGMEGEAALDGVFGFSRMLESTAASGDDDSKKGATAEAAPSAFKLSSLFDFSFESETPETKRKKNRLAALGEDLLEGGEEDEEGARAPWHFTQSFLNKEEDEDRAVGTDQEAEDGEEEEEEEEEEEKVEQKGNKTRKPKIQRSLAEFLAFGRTFVARRPEEEEEEEDDDDGEEEQGAKGKDAAVTRAAWLERRKKLTLDFKRKRRDALKTKKKQQAAHRQHQHKRQKTMTGARS